MSGDDSGASEILSYTFIRVFADSGVIDAAELEVLEQLALRDAVVDDDERLVLGNIFSRVSPDLVTPEVWDEIQRFCDEYDIPAP